MRNEKTKLEKLDLEQHLYGCPISFEPVIDPVIASDHQTYERDCIQDVARRNNISPMTREALTPVMYNNIAVRQTNETITELVEKHNNLIDIFEKKYSKLRMSKERIAELEREREDVESQCQGYVEQINALQTKAQRLKGKLGEAKSLNNEYMQKLEERQAAIQINDNVSSESRMNIASERKAAVQSTEETIRLLDKTRLDRPRLGRRGVFQSTVKVTKTAAVGATAGMVAGGVACGVAEAAVGTPVLAAAGTSIIGALGAETALAGVVATIGTGGVALIVFAGIGLLAGIGYGLYQVFKSDEAVDDNTKTP